MSLLLLSKVIYDEITKKQRDLGVISISGYYQDRPTPKSKADEKMKSLAVDPSLDHDHAFINDDSDNSNDNDEDGIPPA